MTVVVQTPEGIKTGSAVREVDASCGPQLLSTAPCNTYLAKGEAVVVNLGKRGVLFALMEGEDGSVDYGYNIVFKAYPFQAPPSTIGAYIKHYRSLKSGKVVLPTALYPMFVYFKNLKDPNSIKSTYYLPSTFGKGVKLKEVTIAMTDEPVTHKIKKWLPWLGPPKPVKFNPKNVPMPGEPQFYKNLLLSPYNFYRGGW